MEPVYDTLHSSEEEFVYPPGFTLLRSPAPPPVHSDVISPTRELALAANSVAALKESLEARGDAFISSHLAPLAEERFQHERTEKVLDLLKNWLLVYQVYCQTNVVMRPEDLARCVALDLDALRDSFPLAYGDYLAARFNGPPEERAQLISRLEEQLALERPTWPTLLLRSPYDIDAELARIAHLQAECLERQLQVEARQTELIGKWEEMQRWSESALQDATRAAAPPNAALEQFCALCESGAAEEVCTRLQASKKATASSTPSLLRKSKTVVANPLFACCASGATALHVAARSGHATVVSMLLEAGFPINQRDNWHHLTAAHWAVSDAKVDCTAVLKVLAAQVGAIETDVLLFATRAGNFTAVQVLVESCGIPVDTTDQHKRTALHESCARGYMGITSYLLAQGADPRLPNMLGETPLFEAFLGKCAAVVVMLARKGVYLSAHEQVRLRDKFVSDPVGRRLLELPHQDAMRRLHKQSDSF